MEETVPELVYDEPVAVIGDIHGCAEPLNQLLRWIGDRPLLILGDVIDRGPDSKGVIEQLVERGARGVSGNHEEWFVGWLARGTLHRAAMLAMEGDKTLLSYGVDPAGNLDEAPSDVVPLAHFEWLSQLHYLAGLTVCGEAFWMVHAGIDPLALENLPENSSLADIVPHLYGTRSHYAHWGTVWPEDTFPVDRAVLMGHRCIREPLCLQHVLALDTAAGTAPWGHLSALLLPERRTLSVEAPRTA